MWLIFKFFHLAWIEIASKSSLQSLVPSWDQKLGSLSWCHQISGMQETNLWPKYEALQNCYEDKQEIRMIFFCDNPVKQVYFLLFQWTYFFVSSYTGLGERSHVAILGESSQSEWF